jgi:formate hydrogenlyase transcriptional activator
MRKTIHWISSSALTALERYDWPSNIREFQNVIERAVILTTRSVLQVTLDPLHMPDVGVSSSPRVQPPQTLVEAERAHVIEALKQAGWVVGGTRGADVSLGIARTTMISSMRRLGIERDRNENASVVSPYTEAGRSINRRQRRPRSEEVRAQCGTAP